MQNLAAKYTATCRQWRTRLDLTEPFFYASHPMNGKTLTLALLIISSWHLPGAAVGDEPLAVAPQEGILVLRSGGILRGAITRAGQEFYVGVGGGEIRLKQDEVEFTCESLEAAYQIKSAALPTGHVSEHVGLAEWCLQQGLIQHAEQELALAKQADASFPKLPLLERRLDLIRRPVQPHISHAPPKAKEAEKPSAEDDILRRVPQRTIETFTSAIQPVLMNGCATAACHGPASNNKLRLERIALGRPTSYRISQRNLTSVLTCIDLENPAASPLLTLPLGAHGTAAEAVLTRRDMEKYRQLVAWVTDVSNNITPPAPNNVSTPAIPLLQTIKQSLPRTVSGKPSPAANNPKQVTVAGFNAEETETKSPGEDQQPVKPTATQADLPERKNGEAPHPFEPMGTMRSIHERQGNKFGAPLKESAPQDPFDPELFNREFGPRR